MPSSSSPIKPSGAQPQTASQARTDLHNFRAMNQVSAEDFLQSYITGYTGEEDWAPEQQQLVDVIRTGSFTGNERLLYTESVPLLRLLNMISVQVLSSRSVPNDNSAVVFCTCHNVSLANPHTKYTLSPDVVVLRETFCTLERLTTSLDPLDFQCPFRSVEWSTLVAVGEVKVDQDAHLQQGNYIQNLLHLHPEQNTVLGFSTCSTGYRLFYHDASVIHYSELFPWTPGPLHAFVRQLYCDQFHNPTIGRIYTNEDEEMGLTWLIRVGEETFVSESGVPSPGFGQRRFTSIVVDVTQSLMWFFKDFWRDERWCFFEGLLYDKAHMDSHLPGLMTVRFHGYVLDAHGKRLETMVLSPALSHRVKMHLISGDVGQPLVQIQSLYQFLCVMYDACVVQQNLYHKCKILHRDISDTNIMVSPTNQGFKAHCSGKYYDQFSARRFGNCFLDGNAKPEPTCLIIDLGNGSDVDPDRRDPEFLAERTGKPLPFDMPLSYFVAMSKLEGRALELCQSINGIEYQKFTEMVQKTELPDQRPTIVHTHRLFHNVESTFWVMAWTLACSVPQNYLVEKEWPVAFADFVYAMEKHRPGSAKYETCLNTPRELEEWRNILHPSLSSMAPMLHQMYLYVSPEWGYRCELDPEHVHEAIVKPLGHRT
ncbi:hypothetical protein CTheo_8422 [Ceratobasidium theobromae]|uniref:Fungal-type protein kinase domain-containing protein n=1 Tax=Ceratobasidium theobromae TaxID=1582974 RepID=A0A5N5Q8T5_9AGAM|nr:hypothetical protein CTheo_8422 [Ceratobasidium theobromae]